MSNKTEATPDIFTLHKLKPDEITDSQSRLHCDGHFFPVSISGVAASEYGQPIYRLSVPEIEIAQGTAS